MRTDEVVIASNRPVALADVISSPRWAHHFIYSRSIMPNPKSPRRTFLKGSIAATAAVGAASLAPSASAKSAAQKKVITRPGEPLTTASLFSPATQLGNLLFLSGSGAQDPKTHRWSRDRSGIR